MTDQVAGDRELRVFGLADDSEQRGWFSRADAEYARGVVSSKKLQEQVRALVEGLAPALDSLTTGIGHFEVESVEIKAEISAKGTVSLLGTGGEVAGAGGIAITLTRRHPDSVVAGQ